MQNKELVIAGERHMKCVITLMSWSSKRDLLCLATENGELLLHRLTSLERVWSQPPVDTDCKINCICWRPDGKLVGISYNSIQYGIHFVYMEKCQVIYSLNNETVLMKRPGMLLRWYEWENESNDLPLQQFASLSFKDYLPELPKLQSKDLNNVDKENIIGSSKFHILLVCDDHSTVTAYAYAVFPLFSVPCAFYGPTGHQVQVVDMCLNDDLQQMVIITCRREKKSICEVQLVETRQVMRNVEKCKVVAEKVCLINSLLSYLNNVLDLMKESCEAVVQEMETKLTQHLVNKNLSGTIGDEFMHFLLWGKPSDVIEGLLENTLSPKNVVKLGTLVEASYTSIQQLLLVNLQLASDALYYHLVEIKGLCSSTILDDSQLLSSFKVEEVLSLAGSFILKMSLKEMEFVADFVMESFIREHEKVKSEKEKHFNLDKVYQYLQNSPLSTLHNTNNNDWFRLAEVTSSLSNNPFILKRRPEASLKQLFVELRDQLQNLFYCSSNVVSTDDVTTRPYFTHSSLLYRPLVSTWFQAGKDGERSFYTLTSEDNLPCRGLLLTHISTRSKKLTRLKIQFSTFEEGGEMALILHFAFFNKDHIAAIVDVTSTSTLAMISLPSILSKLNEHANDVTPYVCDASRHVTLRCSKFTEAKEVACSGTRNILSVIDKGGRSIKAYEVDDASDEDMDEDSINSSAIST